MLNLDPQLMGNLYWIIPLVIWDLVWKAFGMWHSARNKQPVWFFFIFIINSLGILPILYIYFFQKKGKKN